MPPAKEPTSKSFCRRGPRVRAEATSPKVRSKCGSISYPGLVLSSPLLSAGVTFFPAIFIYICPGGRMVVARQKRLVSLDDKFGRRDIRSLYAEIWTGKIRPTRKETEDVFSKCLRINDAYVCRNRKEPGKMPGFTFAFCKTVPGTEAKECSVEVDVELHPNNTAYIEWLGARPKKVGWGSKVLDEVEEWLRTKQCVQRVGLNSVYTAEGFYKKRGYTHLENLAGATKERPWGNAFWKEGREGREGYYSLKPFEKVLWPPKGCKKLRLRMRGPVHYED